MKCKEDNGIITHADASWRLLLRQQDLVQHVQTLKPFDATAPGSRDLLDPEPHKAPENPKQGRVKTASSSWEAQKRELHARNTDGGWNHGYVAAVSCS